MLKLYACLTLTVIALAAHATVAHATTVFVDSDGNLQVLGDTHGADLDISGPAPGTIRVVDASADDDLQPGASAPGQDACTEPTPETVECTGFTSPKTLFFYGSPAGDSVDVQSTVPLRAELYGRAGDDVLLGGPGADRLGGGTGNDDVDGREGSDLVDNGYDDVFGITDRDGADTYTDSGTSGTDMVNYGPQTVGVQIFIDGQPNDGADGEGDNVLAGFERLRGTGFNDTISGGPAAEQIFGSDGDDSISGGAGADRLEGNRGNDTVNAVAGDVDVAVLCDSVSDAPPAGTADVAHVDEGDPTPQGCETVHGPAVQPPPSPGDPPPPGAGPGPAPGPAPAPPSGTGAGPSGPVLGAPVSTAAISRMPRVTGRSFASAHALVLRKLANAEIDLDFRKGCRASSDLEIVQQRPLTGASIPNTARAPVAVRLVACLAERDFLRDCDLADLRSDIRKLPKASLDAELGLALARTVGRCKVDYDIRLQKAAEEASVRLAAQKEETRRDAEGTRLAKQPGKRDAELRLGLNCPVPGDLRIAVADGYTPDRRALGLRASGPGGWTLPAEHRSFIEVTVIDRALHFPEATVYTDADAVSYLKTPPKRTSNGRVQIALDPYKGAGKIRLCVVQTTGSDKVLTGAIEITVVKRPANGSIWETTSGRRLKITADGPVLAKPASRPVARSAGLAEIWDLIVGLFGGRSRSIAAAGGGTAEEKRQRLVDTYAGPKYGAAQISLDGRLSSDPAAPTIRNGPCAAVDAKGAIRPLTCPQLQAVNGTAVVGTRLGGNGLVAAGAGNIVAAGAGNLVAAGAGNLIGLDGGSLIGHDGSTLIGPDGGTLVGMDGASVVAAGGDLVAAGGGNAIAIAPAHIVAAGAGNLIGQDGGSLVAAGGLN